MNSSSGDHLGHHSTSNGTSGHTFSGDMRSLKSIQLKLDQLVGEFHSPNREDGFQQMLQKMEQVRNCQQSLCIAHFEMEKTLDRSADAQTLDDQFRPFDILSGRLTALNDAIKNLHPHQQESNENAGGSGRSNSKYR